ncbi:MAG: adenylate/guanylate cyclase domain-containing protein [Pseudomonadota bacterium]
MRVFSRHWRRIGITLVPVVIVMVHALGIFPFAALRSLDNFIYDARLRITMPRTLDPRVVIIDIDEKSLGELGHWPWGRDKLARLMTELFGRQQAAVVGFDVLFGEADESSGLGTLQHLVSEKGPLHDQPGVVENVRKLQPQLDYDGRFAQALDGQPAVLGYYFTNDSKGEIGVLPQPVMRSAGTETMPAIPPIRSVPWTGASGNIAVLAKAAPYGGFMNTITDPDGVIRSVPLISEFGGNYYESLALGMYRSFRGHPDVLPDIAPGQVEGRPQVLQNVVLNKGEDFQPIAVDDRSSVLVPYRGLGGVNGGSFRYVSAADVVAGRLKDKELAGKIALVGTTAPGLLDLRVAPVGEVYPGVETHANVISSLLDRRNLVRPDWEAGYETVTLVAAGLLLAFALPFLSVPAGILLTLCTIGALAGINFWLFAKQGFVLPLAAPFLTSIAAFALNIGFGYFVESKKGRQVAHLFGTYVPRELVEQMVRQPEGYSMQAENRELTVMFCDMRGFTAMSERMEPLALQTLLNDVFSRLTEIIRTRRGTIDKYMGDCVMAFWGAPVTTPEHARLAAVASIEMSAAVAKLNAEHVAKDLPAIGIGIGLNTGVMCVGDMGSDIRRAYTVIGDAVNLGSRLEGLSKTYGLEIVISETTYAQAAGAFVWIELDKVMVKGKQQAVTIYTPVGPIEAGKPPPQGPKPEWNAMLGAYRAQKWDEAATLLATNPLPPGYDKLAALYAGRIEEARQSPPPADWDGATRFETK